MKKYNLNSFKEYQEAITKVTNLKNKAEQKYNAIMDKYEYLLDEDRDEEWEQIEVQTQYKTNYSNLITVAMNIENEFINYCKSNFEYQDLMNDDLKWLFNQASKSIIIHDELIKKLMTIN